MSRREVQVLGWTKIVNLAACLVFSFFFFSVFFFLSFTTGTFFQSSRFHMPGTPQL